ncbi:GntR family transcriptional regulator [Nocardia sp. NRRL S-836]|uniref:GntR family transcriptional regulator n=1 Tax=Nocardia sp. NRRL S-836 TaxID=1519492 RepID=UPI001E459C3B|nr:GntR family transcriptional regulator [Nocardia sp. NRRL S-836]
MILLWYTCCMQVADSLSGREKAYEFIKDTILAAPEMQGRFISEQDVANQIGVSRTPIREALLLLAAEDLVQLVPKKGAYVAPLSSRQITELMELRGVIERYAAERTMTEGTVPLETMKAYIEEQRVQQHDPREFIDVDRQFHAVLVSATGNELLTKTYEGLRARQVRAGVVALFRANNRQQAVIDEHNAIVAALESGDVGAATAAITAHLDTTLKVLLNG